METMHEEPAVQVEQQTQPEWLPNAQERAQAAIEDFVTNPGLEQITSKFDETFAQIEDPNERLDRLTQIARANWDFRKGKERQDTAEVADIDVPGSDMWNTIFAGANQLGMLEQPVQPEANDEPAPQYDMVVIPGGANRAPLSRLQYVLEQGITATTVVALGSTRPVRETEAAKAADYAPGAKTEFDLQKGAVTTLLDEQLVADDALTIGTSEWRITQFDGQTPTFVLSAPPQGGRSRANTADTYDFLRRIAQDELGPDTNVLLSTTAHYVPFQQFDALREITLRTGATVETIGHSAEYGGNVRKASQLLQEMLSATNSAVHLRDAIQASAA